MIQHARSTVQTNHCRHNQESRCNNPNCVLIAQSDCQNGRSELPSCSIEGVTEPVGYQRPDGPFTVFAADGIKICQMSSLAGQDIKREGQGAEIPILLHLETPNAPENADGTCLTRNAGH